MNTPMPLDARPRCTHGVVFPMQHCSECLAARVAELEAELAEDDALRTRMGDILTLTVNALKGEPDSRSLHDWATLPDVARSLVAHASALRDALVAWQDADHEGENPSDDGARWDGLRELARSLTKEALAAHPAASLAAHDAEVIERLAQKFASEDDDFGVMVAGAIRALAAQAQEVE